MPAEISAANQAGNYEYGDRIRFTNRWGQENQLLIVIRQEGYLLFGSYLGTGCVLDLNTMSAIDTDPLGRPVAES